MKSKHLILGVFLLFLGGLFFIDSLQPLNLNWDVISRLWPLALIFLGVVALNSDQNVKSTFYILTAVLIAFLVFSTVRHGQFSLKNFFNTNSDYPSSQI